MVILQTSSRVRLWWELKKSQGPPEILASQNHHELSTDQDSSA